MGSPREIGGRQRSTARVSFAPLGALAGKPLPEGLDVVERDGIVAIETFEPTRVVGALTAWAASHGEDELPELSVTRPSLEDIYLKMVGESDAEGGAE